jgi:hypothetical protein
VASQPQGQLFEREIEQRGGINWMVEQVLNGRSLRSIAREIGCGHWWLDRWVYADEGRGKALAHARVAAGDRLGGMQATSASVPAPTPLATA